MQCNKLNSGKCSNIHTQCLNLCEMIIYSVNCSKISIIYEKPLNFIKICKLRKMLQDGNFSVDFLCYMTIFTIEYGNSYTQAWNFFCMANLIIRFLAKI